MIDKELNDSELTERQCRVIEEIQRVARTLGVERLSKRAFDEHHQLTGLTSASYHFGSWNAAVRAAGLQPYEAGQGNLGPKLSDEELLQEIVLLQESLGKRPSEYDMARHGRFSPKPYKDRWGSWVKAREAAYRHFGLPSEC